MLTVNDHVPLIEYSSTNKIGILYEHFCVISFGNEYLPFASSYRPLKNRAYMEVIRYRMLKAFITLSNPYFLSSRSACHSGLAFITSGPALLWQRRNQRDLLNASSDVNRCNKCKDWHAVHPYSVRASQTRQVW